MQDKQTTRRTFLASTAVAGASLVLANETQAATNEGQIFTILHTNDLHSNLLGVGPAAEYTPDTANDDMTIGGFARIAALLARRRNARSKDGPVLTLDIGDYSVGTAFGGAVREIGSELQCMAMSGFDATILGNHEFDFGPDGLARSIEAAVNAGKCPPIIASNTNANVDDPGVAGLRKLQRKGVIRRHLIIERCGIKFGLFGMMGPDSITYTLNPGALTFPDPIETAREMVKILREEGADVIICMSHGGVKEPDNGPIIEGDDILLARAVPEIGVIVGGHTHTFIREPLVVNGTPISQAGCYGQAVGEMVLRLKDGKVEVISQTVHPVDDRITGDPKLTKAIEKFSVDASRIVFEPRSFKIDEPLAVIEEDWTNTFFDLEASRPIGNLMADAIRYATKTDIALHAAGMVRASLPKGKTGVQTVYDLFLLAPLGIGVNDQSAGGSLLVAYLTGREIKNCLEFLLVGNPNLPGQYFPRVSGMRFRYDMSRPKFDAITEIELGDLDGGYHPIDISAQADALYSVSCNLFFALILLSIPEQTKGKLTFVPKNSDGSPMKSRVEAVPARQLSPFLLPSKGTVDTKTVVSADDDTTTREIKEWQAVMEYVRSLASKNDQGVTILTLDEKATEDRSIAER